MKLEVLRYSSQSESTLGLLFDVTTKRTFLSYTLEDPHQKDKIKGVTRIPEGSYSLSLQKSGILHGKYKDRFEDDHYGMVIINNVPNFSGVMIHCGNSSKDTSGCLLLGETANTNIHTPGFISRSSAAYQRSYPLIYKAIQEGPSTLTIKDYDVPTTI